MTDSGRRWVDVNRFFGSRSASERRAIIRCYGVSFVLFDLRRDRFDMALGIVVHRDQRYVFVAVDDEMPALESPQ